MKNNIEKNCSDSALNSGMELIKTLYHLNIIKITEFPDLTNFCKTHRVHSMQKYLYPDTLDTLCKTNDDFSVHICEDRLMICLAIFRINGCSFVAGPFRQNILTKKDSENLLHALNATEITVADYLHYHETFPIITEEDIKSIVASLLHVYSTDSGVLSFIKHDDYSGEYINSSTPEEMEMSVQADRPYYMTMLERRYTFEQHFIENIEAGNARSALMNLENMQHDVSYLKKIGTTMENERIGAAITRTTARLAAIRAGLPAIIADRISSENTRKTMTAKTTSEILKAKEELVQNFCRAILEHNDENHSALAQSALYYLRHEYYHPISLDTMADTLSVSKNYLISVFKKEYKTTPINFLNDYRLKQAATLLASTSSTVQEISNSVGIDDANYFVKLFKKKYGMTPTEYRRRNKI